MLAETTDPAEILAGVFREPPPRDILAFARSVGFEPEDWQASLLQSKAKRLVINCFRGAGKSATCGILALHELITRPDFEILVVSRDDSAAKELVYHVRRRMRMLDEAPVISKQNEHEMVLSNGSRMLSVACGDNTPRGYHVDMLIEDEASVVPDSVFMAALPTVTAKKGRYLMLSTPHGKAGHFWDVFENKRGWSKITATWRDCQRFDAEQLEQIEGVRATMTVDWFRQEYEGAFVSTSGQLFAEADIERAFSEEVKQIDTTGLSWGMAA